MAKLALINREKKREATVAKFAAKRAALKAIINDATRSMEERMEARAQLQALPRDTSPVRLRNRCTLTGRPRAVCERVLREAIDLQEPVAPTERLVGELKRAGYRLYVLSNMSREFIDCLRRFPVYALFDGEVVSCEEGTVKPEPRIYEILLGRYGLDPAETLFIDDRPANVAAAEALGIRGFGFDHRDPAAACDALRRRLLQSDCI